MPNQVLFILIGLGAGILSGMFGIGGGVVIVPALVFFLGLSQQAASGTSLLALLLPVGLLGAFEYFRAGKIGPDNLKAGLLIAVGLFFGAYFGSKIALALPEIMMRKIFAVFMVFVAAKLWFSK